MNSLEYVGIIVFAVFWILFMCVHIQDHLKKKARMIRIEAYNKKHNIDKYGLHGGYDDDAPGGF